MAITDLNVRIQPRVNVVNGINHPFCEVLYTFTRDGVPMCAMSRLFHPLDDSPHARAFQAQAFMTRQAKGYT